MDESGSGSTINLSKDPVWKYCEIVNNNRNETKCNFCSSVFKGGAHRAKQHLAGGYRNAKDCKNVPPHVREEIQNYMSKKKVEKASSMRGVFDDFEVNDVELEGGASGTKDSTSIHSFVSSYKGNKRKRQGQGLIDKFVQRTDQASHKGKERQTTINEAYKKEMREKSCKSIAKWMYDAAIPFNAVNYPSFQEMIDDISRHGPGLKAPTYHEIRVPYLKKVVDDVENDYVKICQEEWVQYGCSLMMDGWTDRRQRTLINFLVNSPNGSVFIESIDASDYAKTGQRMFELMDKFVDRIGEENVVQIITDNASNMKLAGQLLMEKRKHLYWTPCAAHCIDLILEDIGKLSEFKSTLKKATSVTSFIYVRPGVVNMLRQFTGNMELCRAGVTRFAAAFLTLQRMYSLKPKLRSMLASKEWAESKWSKESEGKKLLQYLHSENKLSKRFPIGLEDQIKKWDADKIRKFHERWYFPANATLYIVGDIDDIPKTVNHIEEVFGQYGIESEASVAPTPNAFGAMASFLVPKLGVGLSSGLSQEKSPASLEQSKNLRKERHAVRPPVQHNWSIPESNTGAKPPQIFQHELLQNFSINMFCKIPVNKVHTFGDLRNVLMKRIFLSALHFRINTRYQSSNPPFTSVELDHSDSGREGCTVTTLTVTAEPQNWRNAIKVAVQEVRRLKEFGVTNGELARYLDALLKDSEQLAAMIDNVPSVDNLDFIMESDALGHTVMDQRQGHESLVAVAGTVTLEEVNAVGSKVLEFIADYGKPSAPPPAAIVACVPRKVHIDGIGETEFKIEPEEILTAIEAGLEEPIEAEPELEIPKELISSEQLQELLSQRRPSFIPVDQENKSTKIYDKDTGIVQRRLSNGIPVNYKVSKNEANCGVMRLIVGGGRAAESADAKGAVIVGVRTLSEGGRVGNFSREQVELFCVNHLINCSLESTEEFISMEFRFTLRDDGMRAAFQLLHMVLQQNIWLEDAFDRAKQLYLSYYRSIPKSLERSTAHKLMLAMLDGDERFVEPTPNSLQQLTLEQVKDAVMNQFVCDNMEVCIVGDFTEEDIETCITEYLGTVKESRGSENAKKSSPIIFRPYTAGLQHQEVFLKDTDERACAYVAGPAPNRWGFTFEGKNLRESVINVSASGEQLRLEEQHRELGNAGKNLQGKLRAHPLFFAITMCLLQEIINSRLFTTVRDSLGLTYDVSFELNLFDRLNLGWHVISVTSTPEKVHKAVDACKNVLRGLHSNRIAPRELDRARRTLLMRHEAEIKSNAYWLGLMAHLQAASVPRKDISCIKELTSLYEAATLEDVYVAYEHLKIDEDSLFSCIGIAGSQAGEVVADSTVEEELVEGFHNVIPVGRGSSTMTRPTT